MSEPPLASPADTVSEPKGAEYRVLARKYRPSNFSELVGQDALVRTLSNAIQTGRIAHAFMLTGVRGVGKTTTARIIARALNCVGPDGKGQPTIDPCGICDACRGIAEDRHPDVIEMDAASRTGIDDVREVIESVRYRPVSARFKIYIIDEVHMLSKQAFNALLKTLEEPPPDIKFVFATTEINKVPVTVLSRCQRYTLPRIPQAVLAKHYQAIALKERVEIEPPALALIARSADGSARDGLSILDQAIALTQGGAVTEAMVREMLGTADRTRSVELFQTILSGDAGGALAGLERLYNDGVEPAAAIEELLDITHTVTRWKIGRPPSGGIDEDDGSAAWAKPLADRLGVAVLARCWQMLLKGLAEVQSAARPLQAAEMVLIRLAYVTDLPPPAEIVKTLQSGAVSVPAGNPGGGGGSGPRMRLDSVPGGGGAPAQLRAVAAPVQSPAAAAGLPQNFAQVMALIADAREAILHATVARNLHLVRFEPGKIEFRPAAEAPRDMAQRLGAFLLEHTGRRWIISVSREMGEATYAEQLVAAERRLHAEAEADPLIAAALALFPGAKIDRVTSLTDPASAAPDVAAVARIGDMTPDIGSGPPEIEDDPGPFADMSAMIDPDEDDQD